jgi:hypothetical protein
LAPYRLVWPKSGAVLSAIIQGWMKVMHSQYKFRHLAGLGVRRWRRVPITVTSVIILDSV